MSDPASILRSSIFLRVAPDRLRTASRLCLTRKRIRSPFWLSSVFAAIGLVAFAGCPWQSRAIKSVASLPGGELALPESDRRESSPVVRSDDPDVLLAALRSPSPTAKLDALGKCDALPTGELPAEIRELRNDPDARVRAAVLPIVARSGDAEAGEYLAAALSDSEIRVRLAAVRALGELRTDAAQAPLRAVLNDPSELMRAAAVESLAAHDCKEAVLAAANDSSWRVRLAVAKAIHRYPERASAGVVATLLGDASAPVQQQAVASLADWPLAQAGPLLLEAMGGLAYVTRKAASEQLAGRWEPAGRFPVDGPSQRRNGVLEQLRQEFREDFGFADAAALAGPVETTKKAAPRSLQRVVQLVEQLERGDSSPEVRSAAIADLQALGGEAIVALEHLVVEQHRALPEVVYREVLPAVSPVFAELGHMSSDDAGIRRRAAGHLAEQAGKQPPSRLAVARLAEISLKETDALVWQSLLTVIAEDGSEPAIRLAALAIGHPAPEVRRRACEHLAVHPAAGNAALLVPALKDPSDTVAAAAARALGRLDRLDDAEPLRQLLASPNEMARLNAAIALARHGEEAGRAALERLSYSGDELVRRRVATAMGDVPHRSFLPSLIRLLDDRQSIRIAALASLPKVVGHHVTGPAGTPSSGVLEQIEMWKRWYAGQSGGP